MGDFLYTLFKNSPVKSISVTTLLFLVIVGTAIVKAGDTRWMLAASGKDIQQEVLDHQIMELDTEIFILNLKANGASQEEIDAALKEKYEGMLLELKKKKNEGH